MGSVYEVLIPVGIVAASCVVGVLTFARLSRRVAEDLYVGERASVGNESVTGELELRRRVEELEQALEEVTLERSELWAELHRRIAVDQELEHYRYLVRQLEESRSWKLTAPLRWVKARIDRMRHLFRLVRTHLGKT